MNNTTEFQQLSSRGFDWKIIIVPSILSILNILISIGKQYLNNNKHLTFEDKLIQALQKGTKQNQEAKPLEAFCKKQDDAEGIELNLPENLRASEVETRTKAEP